MFDKILFPTDFSDVAAKALQYVKQLRAAGGREVVILHVIDQSNEGLAAARNAGMRAGRSPYVLFLDADNTLLPGGLQAMRAALDGDAAAAVAYGDRE